VSLLDHAAYLGKELYKAELAIRYGRSFEQDGEF
jgi:dihydropteroate synthase